ncbi:DUF4806 domain-containing protein [Aphis craccivora]|uniref:DUF4806 domain-containing protein n=1 Tax=Aphis craccivora TaxID=307492 RepID=A0A6G0YW91_APHCR|nr:DUF4806 domain-containing protein [Aphis craccivora]
MQESWDLVMITGTKKKKMAIKNPSSIFLNKELVSDSESKDDSDLDPDFTLHIDSSPICQIFSNDNNENVHIVYSPNEKSFPKTKTLSDSKLLKSQKKYIFASFKTSEMETLSKSQCNIPSKRKNFDDFQEIFFEKSCFEQQNSDDFSSALTLKTSSSTASNQDFTLSNRKTGIEPTMSLAGTQIIVIACTNKSVGVSVRRVLSRIFDDKVLENYSTYGF